MSETENPVLLTREGPVVRLTLNRPHRRNAMSAAMGVALDAALDALEKDSTARIVVFSGAGGHFCAGLDLTEVGSQGTEAERLAAAQQRNHATGQRFVRLCNLPQVVIAAVQGSAHAGGLGWVCSADIAIATADARFAAPPFQLGRYDAGIVEHQTIAGPKNVRQIADRSVGCRIPIQQQEACCVPRLGGAQGDQVLGKIKVEEIDAH